MISLVPGDTLQLVSTDPEIIAGRKPVMVVDGEDVFFGGSTWTARRIDAFNALMRDLRALTYRDGRIKKRDVGRLIKRYATAPDEPGPSAIEVS